MDNGVGSLRVGMLWLGKRNPPPCYSLETSRLFPVGNKVTDVAVGNL